MATGPVLFMKKSTKTDLARIIFEKNFGKILKEELIKKAAKETGINAKSLRLVYDSMEVDLMGKAGERNRLEREARKRKEVTTFKGRPRRKILIDLKEFPSFWRI